MNTESKNKLFDNNMKATQIDECINEVKEKKANDDKRIINYKQLSDIYEQFKEKCKDKQNFYLNYFYFFFGEHYESIINNVNFFHFATQALLIEFIKNSKGEDLEIETNSSSREVIIKKFKSLKIDPSNFYENLRLLTGSCYSYDQATKLSEKRLSNIFLKNFNSFKKKIELEFVEVENINKIFLHCCHLATSSTIHQLNLLSIGNNEKDHPNLFYFSYTEMNNSKQNLILLNYIKIIQKNLNIESELIKDKNILNVIKLFYFYSKTTYEDYLFDLELFSDHSGSLYEKIKKISIQNCWKINSSMTKMINNSRAFVNLKNFYSLASKSLNEKTGLVLSKVVSLKNWINESFQSCPTFFYEKYNFSRIFLYEKILTPSQYLMVLYTDKCVTFLITNLVSTKKTMTEFSQYFLDNASIFMDNLESKINEKELCIRFTLDEKVNFIKIDLDNTVLMINSKNFKEYVENVYVQMMQNSFDLYEKSKNYLINKYRLFLGEEDDKLLQKKEK